jgi:glycerol-3-phosphate dehydrogenase
VESIIIIGGGIGGAVAHDLTLRGYRVTLLERGPLLSGSTGRHHGLLHSGARYAPHDIDAARECLAENKILREIAPQGLEQNNGLFVALNEEDLAFRDRFIERCQQAGIPAIVLPLPKARQLEPELHAGVLAAVQVPDATMDAWRLGMHFFATARFNGADIRPFSEVTAIVSDGKQATGVEVYNHRTQRTYVQRGDIIVNAAGPWAGKVASSLGIRLPLMPAPGVMVSIARRLTRGVINRLHPAGEGDIIVPQRSLSLLGTTVWLDDDPDQVELPAAHVRRIIDECARMVPKLVELPIHAAWCAARPLIVRHTGQEPTQISRTFDCIDHTAADGIEGFISLLGGKATTMRAMAERAGNLVNAKTGRETPCRTREIKLRHYRRFYDIVGQVR